MTSYLCDLDAARFRETALSPATPSTDRLASLLALDLGRSIAEMLILRIGDVRPLAGLATDEHGIIRKYLITDKRGKTVEFAITTDLAAAIHSRLLECADMDPDTLLFAGGDRVTPVARQTVHRGIVRIAEQAGLGRGVCVKTLQKTFLHRCLTVSQMDPARVMKLSGHTSPTEFLSYLGVPQHVRDEICARAEKNLVKEGRKLARAQAAARRGSANGQRELFAPTTITAPRAEKIDQYRVARSNVLILHRACRRLRWRGVLRGKKALRRARIIRAGEFLLSLAFIFLTFVILARQ